MRVPLALLLLSPSQYHLYLLFLYPIFRHCSESDAVAFCSSCCVKIAAVAIYLLGCTESARLESTIALCPLGHSVLQRYPYLFPRWFYRLKSCQTVLLCIDPHLAIGFLFLCISSKRFSPSIVFNAVVLFSCMLPHYGLILYTCYRSLVVFR